MQQQPKLYQRIAAEGFRPPPYGWSTKISDADMSAFLISTMRKAQIIVADDAYTYYLTKWAEEVKAGNDGLLEDDCQALLPPFPCYWMEGAQPGHEFRYGALFLTERADDGWQMSVRGALAKEGAMPIFPALAANITVTKEGRPEKVTWIGPNRFREDFPDARRRQAVTQQSVCPFLATHTLLSCRNCTMDDFPIERKYYKHIDRKFGERGPDFYKFKTITIRDTKTGSPINLIERDEHGKAAIPEHLVRGHVSHYGPAFNKGKLFGKYEGAFFIPPHQRGKREHGRVEKQYVVKPPDDAPLQPAGGDA